MVGVPDKLAAAVSFYLGSLYDYPIYALIILKMPTPSNKTSAIQEKTLLAKIPLKCKFLLAYPLIFIITGWIFILFHSDIHLSVLLNQLEPKLEHVSTGTIESIYHRDRKRTWTYHIKLGNNRAIQFDCYGLSAICKKIGDRKSIQISDIEVVYLNKQSNLFIIRKVTVDKLKNKEKENGLFINTNGQDSHLINNYVNSTRSFWLLITFVVSTLIFCVLFPLLYRAYTKKKHQQHD